MVTQAEWDALAQGTYGSVDQDPYRLTEDEAESIAEVYDAPDIGTTDPTLGIGSGLTNEDDGAEVVQITEDTSAGAIADPATGSEVDTDTDPHGVVPSVTDDASDWWDENDPAGAAEDAAKTAGLLILGVVAFLVFLLFGKEFAQGAGQGITS